MQQGWCICGHSITRHTLNHPDGFERCEQCDCTDYIDRGVEVAWRCLQCGVVINSKDGGTQGIFQPCPKGSTHVTASITVARSGNEVVHELFPTREQALQFCGDRLNLSKEDILLLMIFEELTIKGGAVAIKDTEFFPEVAH